MALQPCGAAVAGRFYVGQMRVGQSAICPPKPRLRLVGKAYSVTATDVGTVRVSIAKAVLRLTGRPVALGVSHSLALGKPRLRLGGRAYVVPIPVTVTFGKAMLRLRGKGYATGVSQTLALGKPRLLLRGGAIRRAGQPGLIPSAPELIVLTPSACQPVVLTPAPCEDGGVLTPTPVTVV